MKETLHERFFRWLFRQYLYEQLHFSGVIRARVPPFETREEWAYWWLPEMVGGKIVRVARMSEREKERYTVYEARNMLMLAGRTQILTYIGSNNGNSTGFAQYFAVGTFPINKLTAGDTSLQGELFRAIPSTSAISGTQIDVSTFFGSSQAVGTYTNAGLFGNGATGTSGSGTLMTHSLYAYTKPNTNPLVNDYLITQS